MNRVTGLAVAIALALGVSGAHAATTCFDPVPDPLAAGWTQDGGGTFQSGARLLVVDPGLGANDFKTFRNVDAAIFQGDVVLTPRLTVEPGFVPVADGNIGIHVTIHDGANQFRAVLFREGVASVRVRISLAGDVFSPGFAFPGLGADFSMSRLANGSMVLAVANPVVGGPPLQEVFNNGDVPQTAAQNLEFGTYAVASSSTTNWETLGLPANADFPAGLTVRQIRIKDEDSNDKLRLRANFTEAAGSGGIDPATEQVTFKCTNAAGQFYPPGTVALTVNPGEFEFRENERPRRWTLSDAGRARLGVERFEILEEDGTVVFVDRRTDIVSGSYASITVELDIGSDTGNVTVALEEKPPGSGRWRIDR